MGGLTKARIRDRTYAYEINGNKVGFEILRHPGAFTEGYVKYVVIQKWEFDFDSQTIKEIE